jgi:hypothetical protein
MTSRLDHAFWAERPSTNPFRIKYFTVESSIETHSSSINDLSRHTDRRSCLTKGHMSSHHPSSPMEKPTTAVTVIILHAFTIENVTYIVNPYTKQHDVHVPRMCSVLCGRTTEKIRASRFGRKTAAEEEGSMIECSRLVRPRSIDTAYSVSYARLLALEMLC